MALNIHTRRFPARADGYVEVGDLADAEDGDLAALGLEMLEITRLRLAIAGGPVSPAERAEVSRLLRNISKRDTMVALGVADCADGATVDP